MSKKRPARPPSAPQAARWSLKWWHVAAVAVPVAVVAVLVYGPALNGAFVFDDQYLPFFSPQFAEQPLLVAIKGVRPLLMFTFWVNNHLGGTEPYLYHLFNLLIHLANSLLVFFIVRRFVEWSGLEGKRREWLAAFAGGLFLLHPAQTEAVAYVASRSESLSALFFLAAIALFVSRKRAAVSWPVALGVLALYAAAVSTKEHAVVLPALLLLIDYFWNPGFSFQGIRRNWRLYAPMAAGCAIGGVFVFNMLKGAVTAGFGMHELPWHHYFFTQWRALWIYLRLYVFPIGLNADYDYPIVPSPFDPGALAGLAGLLLLVGGAVYFRKRYPLASFGFLSAMILFAPTSSVVPILDAVAERRLYLPMAGLVLVAVELLRRWPVRGAVVTAAAGAVLAVFALLTYQRNHVWADSVALWEDTVAKSPHNARAHFQLGVAYYYRGRYDAAVREYEASAKAGKPDYRLLLDWALAEDRLNRPERALDKLRQAAALERNSYLYSLMGMIYGKQGKTTEALAAIETALKIDPRDDAAYFYRGNLRSVAGDFAGAAADYRRAIDINPRHEQAQRGLARVMQRLGSR